MRQYIGVFTLCQKKVITFLPIYLDLGVYTVYTKCVTNEGFIIMITTTIHSLHEVNINARAARLFSEEGYRFRILEGSSIIPVFPPDVTKDAYLVNPTEHTCTCEGHKRFGVCSHRIAVENLLWEEEVSRRAEEREMFDMAGEIDYFDF